jgi:geranylgeranyl diphosphate synthase type I
MDRFSPSLSELSRLVDDELKIFLAARRNDLPEAEEMIAEIDRTLSAGGKRLRPAFCYWGFRASGGRHCDEIVRAASSLELLHTFALVHDDIMDRSDERRGIPTTYAAKGTDIALLVGDLALVLADAAFTGSGFEAGLLWRGFGLYSRMRQQVIAGQYLDVRAAEDPEITVEEARRIAVLKSGRYSIEEPLLIGATLGGAPEELREGLAHFGAPLGEAFQLRDDLLGTFGERSSVGKPVDSDIREGKRNVLYAQALQRASSEDRGFLAARWGGAGLTDDEIERLRSLLVHSGARSATEGLLDGLRAGAEGMLAGLQVTDEVHAALGLLVRRATDRDV